MAKTSRWVFYGALVAIAAGWATMPSPIWAAGLEPPNALRSDADGRRSPDARAERFRQIDAVGQNQQQSRSIARTAEVSGLIFVDDPTLPQTQSAAVGAAPRTTMTERINKLADDFNTPPLERGARNAHESAVLKGQEGWGMRVLLAMERGRWDIALPTIGAGLLFVVVVLGGISLLGKLLGARKA